MMFTHVTKVGGQWKVSFERCGLWGNRRDEEVVVKWDHIVVLSCNVLSIFLQCIMVLARGASFRYMLDRLKYKVRRCENGKVSSAKKAVFLCSVLRTDYLWR